MRLAVHHLLLLLILSVAAPAAFAQQRPGAEGVLSVVNWPESALEKADLSQRQIDRALAQYDLLPDIDTLTVGYRYSMVNDEPEVTLALEWKPGRSGILDGKRVAFEQMPDSLLLTSLSLEADVFADGERVAEAVIRIDNITLSPFPDMVQLAPTIPSWNELFVNTPPRAARRIFEEGFEFRNLSVVTASFESFDESRDEFIAGKHTSERQTPSRRTVYDGRTVTNILIDLGWLFPPRVWGPDIDRNRNGQPRGDDMGRGSDARDERPRGSARRGADEGATADRSSSDRQRNGDSGESPRRTSRGKKSDSPRDKSDDGDSEDDDEKLLPAALTAAAAVGILAYKGGTVGYFGNAKFAPYGISAGMVRQRGGFLLQVGINDAVLGNGDGPEHLIGKVLAFRQVLPVPIQPAVGLGARVSHENDRYEYEPSFSVGALGNFGPVIVHGAYDLTFGGVEIGAAFNFRR